MAGKVKLELDSEQIKVMGRAFDKFVLGFGPKASSSEEKIVNDIQREILSYLLNKQ